MSTVLPQEFDLFAGGFRQFFSWDLDANPVFFFSQVATGVLGDSKDLGTLLDWAQKFWRDNEVSDGGNQDPEYPWAQEIRLVVAESMSNLCRAFDSLEQAHRKAHDRAKDKKADLKVRDAQFSRAFL